jgi:monoamine oxidase
MNKQSKIIIIGAGLAGLTAGYRLYQKGYDVEIYEAHPRVGGRVHSVLIENFEGEYSVAELGGQNITDGGEAKNFHALAQEFNLLLSDNYIDFTSLFYDGKNFFDDAVLLKKLNINRTELENNLAELEQSCHSMQEVLDKMLFDQPILKRLFTFMLTGYEGSSPCLLSTYHNITTFKYMLLGGLSEAHDLPSEEEKLHMQAIKGGNALLPLKLAEKLGDRVKMNKALKSVGHGENQKILLKFQDNTTVSCDQLILAIPTPVYKDIFFENNIIPKEQLDLIEKVQYGKNAKILIPIQYNDIKHNSIITDNMIGFFNTDSKLLNMYFINDNGSYSFKDNLFTESVSVLKQGYEHVKFNEALPIAAEEEQLKRYQIPVAKSWVSDPYTQGSYSNYSVALGDKLKNIIPYKNIQVKQIFQPLNDQIFFIGEHATILAEIGTMEAAIESGERIAQLF